MASPRERLLADTPESPGDQTLSNVANELITSLEELSVTEEELRQQNEVLSETRLALEQERARYKDLFDAAPDAYLVTDTYGVILEANWAASRLLNIDVHFLVGKPLANLVHESERRIFRQKLDQAVHADFPAEWDLTVTPRRDGPLVTSTTVKRGTDFVTGGRQLLWTLRDVTERRRLEAAVIADRNELDRRVNERTGELLHALQEKEQLLASARKAQTALESANRLTGEFLAVLSHEFRTPLQAMCGYTEILEEGIHGPLNEAQRTDLQRMRRSQDHLLGLISTILDFAKLRSGHASAPEIGPVPIDEMLRSIFPMIEPQMAAKGLELVYDPGPPSLTAYADREKVRQILVNLLANAVKFTARGRITVSTTPCNERVEIRVADTGRGIPEGQLELIFEPFVQLGMRNEPAGTGLGLSISRNLATAMGGTLRATSALGEGSTFILTLPARRLEEF